MGNEKIGPVWTIFYSFKSFSALVFTQAQSYELSTNLFSGDCDKAICAILYYEGLSEKMYSLASYLKSSADK